MAAPCQSYTWEAGTRSDPPSLHHLIPVLEVQGNTHLEASPDGGRGIRPELFPAEMIKEI